MREGERERKRAVRKRHFGCATATDCGCITSVRTMRAIQIYLITLSGKIPNYFAYFLMHALHISLNIMCSVVVVVAATSLAYFYRLSCVSWHIFRTLSLPEFDFNCLCRQARETNGFHSASSLSPSALFPLPYQLACLSCVRHSFTCIHIHPAAASTCFKPNLIRNNGAL